MSIVKCPLNCTSVTIGGIVYTPDVNGFIVVTDAIATILTDELTGIFLITTALVSGAITIRLSSIMSAVTINGIVYTTDVNNQIIVPAADGTIFLYQYFTLIVG